MSRWVTLIMAAGKSTRFKSARPKVLHSLNGRPMLDYVLDMAYAISDTPPVLIVGPETSDEIAAKVGDRARCVVQHERLGTGHAVMQAEPLLRGQAEQVLVLSGDMPLLRVETLRALTRYHEEQNAALTVLTVTRADPRSFGRILRGDDGRVLGIIEDHEATPEQRRITELNTGIYTFRADFLWDALHRLTPSAAKGEYYLTDLVALAAQDGLRVAGLPLEDESEGLGINTRADLALAASVLRQRINTAWMLAGVTLEDPATTYIGPEVTIAPDTVILPNTHILGKTRIGAECEIGPNTYIVDCTIGNRCRVTASFLEEAVMEDESNIGPFGHLRKGSRLCVGAHMGNFGEMKNSTLGPGAKMGHFSYLGDAEVGPNVNIGAGTITCNYDGVRKHRTVIEEGAFIGSDTMLVAPVHIGAGAKTGAGSVVTHDIPSGAVAYGVPARIKQQTPVAPEDEEKA